MPVTLEYAYKKNGVPTTDPVEIAAIEVSVAKAVAEGRAKHIYTRNGVEVTDPEVIAEIEANISEAEAFLAVGVQVE